MTSHSERVHALLSASGAERWLACPPSARLTEGMQDSSSDYADEGEAAHEYAEMCLRRRLTVLKKAQRDALDAEIEFFKGNSFYGDEMERSITDYMVYVEELVADAMGRSDMRVLLEQRLDYSAWVPEGFGTGDVVIMAGDLLDVVDLKYGVGIAVNAVNNPQMRLYALGAIEEHDWLYGFKQVRMTIYQPRRDSVTSETISVEELLAWGESIKPKAAMAFAGEGEFVNGEHCKWCAVKATCAARRSNNMAVMAYGLGDPRLISLDDISSLLHIAPELQRWAKDVQEFAQTQAAAGVSIPGWKLVTGKGKRAIPDKAAAIAALKAAEIQVDKYLKPQELRGITELEKGLGRAQFKELLGDLVVKPPGAPTLAPESDPRESIEGAKDAFANTNLEDDQ